MPGADYGGDWGCAVSPHRPEVHEFAERIFEKCNRRQRRRGNYSDRWPDAVRDMVRDLLTKEGWRRPKF